MLILVLNKGSCAFVTSDFPAENPRTQNRNYSYTKPLANIVLTQTQKNSDLKLSNFKEKRNFKILNTFLLIKFCVGILQIAEL